MSKNKSREVIRLPGKSHNIPRVMVPVLDRLLLFNSTKKV